MEYKVIRKKIFSHLSQGYRCCPTAVCPRTINVGLTTRKKELGATGEPDRAIERDGSAGRAYKAKQNRVKKPGD